MRYSQYFKKAEQLSLDDKPDDAAELIREAETYASNVVAEHLCLCAKTWKELLRDDDNARRCLYLSEVNLWKDCRELLFIANYHLTLFNDSKAAARCALKASHFASKEEDWMRLEEFFQKLGIKDLAEKCHRQYNKMTTLT